MNFSYPFGGQHKARVTFADPAMGSWFHYTLGGLGASDVLIPSAQVLLLNTTAQAVVPAPGSGFYNVFVGAAVFLDYGGTAYAGDAGEDLVFKYTDKNGAALSHTIDDTVFEATSDTLAFAYPLNAAASTLKAAENAPIVVTVESGNWATGNSPLKIRTFYRTVSKAVLEGIR